MTDVVLCAGQTSVDDLFHELREDATFPVFAIGGAEHAGELDAKRAIDQGVRLATRIELCGNQPVRRVHRQFFTKSFLGDGAAVLARRVARTDIATRASRRASMAWRTTR